MKKASLAGGAASELTRAADRYQKAAAVSQRLLATDAAHLAAVNSRLLQSERQFIDEAGLPRRPWYRHLLYAPGFYTGYGVKTMPGVREAIEDQRYGEVEREVVRVAAALARETALLDGLSKELERLPQ